MNKSILFSALLGLFSQGLHAQYDPTQQWNGKIGKTLPESQPYKAEPIVKATKGAPNVVWILLDDVGFGAISSFGGLIQTPTFDSLANNGLKYTNFHTTAICSPTRATLITGRNQHSAHMGLFPETAVNYPGYDARIPFEKATIAEVLRENGYNTFALGKWHITPVNEATQAGPFNRWPTGRGFDKYYGFLYGETDQFHPQLVEGTTPVETDNGTHLNTLLADKAIKYITDQKSTSPDKPFFLYLATGAGHAPHQVEKEWIDKYKGKFDQGWDYYREQVLANQKKLGIVPQNVVLPPHNPGIKSWDSLSVDEKKLFTRFFEVYAGFISQTDYEIGRIVKHLKKLNQLDNTLIVLVVGDNGASKEGTFGGVVNGLGEYFEGNRENSGPKYDERIKNLLKSYDKIGTEYSSPNYPLGWAQATNTPFRYWKQDANSEGGTRNPLIVFYPKGIKDKGGIRDQYTHVNSVWPTTVELIGAKVPQVINGYVQEPAEGISLGYTIDNPKAPSRHNVQYYEISGTRSIYKDGWKAGTLHKPGTPFEKDKWELYNLNEDYNERFDLAAKNPEKLKELQDIFDSEAQKYNVYPLKDGLSTSFGAGQSAYEGQSTVVLYPGVAQIFGASGPSLTARPFSITADVEITDKTNEGALLAVGSRFEGFSFFVKEGKLQVAHNHNSKVTYLVSDRPVPTGKVALRFDFNFTQPKAQGESAGKEILYINNQKVAEKDITPVHAYIFAYDEGLDVGRDQLTPVADKYKSPFKFTGKLNNITINYPQNNREAQEKSRE
ncbi:arylsulfatase [Sporocytophaga myxococcoides]|uniref:arylsulfatase n=1 Tax=Sporocytophaga myxococcoides TaxID=153721 RepID=UPI000421955E|nr:arylsulfatase [Sporocytophaga myxococcoides]